MNLNHSNNGVCFKLDLSSRIEAQGFRKKFQQWEFKNAVDDFEYLGGEFGKDPCLIEEVASEIGLKYEFSTAEEKNTIQTCFCWDR